VERRLCGGTAIDDLDGGDLEEAGLGLTLAAALVACAAILLVLVPIAVALFQPEVPLAWVGGIAAGAGAALGGVKLLAIAWAAGTRLLRPHPAPASPAFAD
jgi:hypothetical protein